ncbi:MAG: hypothetical protein RIA65_13815, partial [Woeseia sp.]
LEILFFRLAELDPPSALAIVRSSPFNQMRSLEPTVWHAWARNDLDEALFAAKTQPTRVLQKTAAKHLYAAFGYMGNDITQRIEAELGIEPDRATRSLYLYTLIDRSPTDAIAYINGLGRQEQQDYVYLLASYLMQGDLNDAIRYADLFDVAEYRERFKRIINRELASENPKAVLDSWLAAGSSRRDRSELSAAIGALAKNDLAAAKTYFEQARTANDRQNIAAAIVSQLMDDDPAAALIWARENEIEGAPNLETQVLSRLAQTDPDLAIAEALKSSGSSMRSMLVSNIIQQMARNDPATAATYLEQLPSEQLRRNVSQNVAMTWMNQDAGAAIDWILQQDRETRDSLTQVAIQILPEMDVDAAISLLPKLDAAKANVMRQRIAQIMAINQSPSEAFAFIQPFAGQPGYEELQVSVIKGIARTDAIAAKLSADQLAPGTARDRAYIDIISHRAQSHPAEAANWLQRVDDEGLRGAAAGRLVSNWYEQDPMAATSWATSLPNGGVKDDAIMHMAGRWQSPGTAELDMVNSMNNRDKRGQAKVQLVYRFMQSDPARAKELVNDRDIPDHQRQRLEQAIIQFGL